MRQMTVSAHHLRTAMNARERKAWQVKLLEKEVAALKGENKIVKEYNASLKETNQVLQVVVQSRLGY